MIIVVRVSGIKPADIDIVRVLTLAELGGTYYKIGRTETARAECGTQTLCMGIGRMG